MPATQATVELFSSAKAGEVDALQRAFASGAAVDAVDEAGWSATMWAARYHHLAAVRALVALGANPALRNGLNHDALDISAQHYLEDRAAAFAVQEFLQADAGYQRQRAQLTARAQSLARALAREFKGRSRRQRIAYANSDYEVVAEVAGMRCSFRVFAGGFDLVVHNFRAGPLVASLHLERHDNAAAPKLWGAWKPWGNDAANLPLYYDADTTSIQAMQGLMANPQCRTALEQLALGRFEWLVWVPGHMRFRCQTEGLDLVRTRMAALASVFEHLSRPLPPPLFKARALQWGTAGDPGVHCWGGTPAQPIACPTCATPFSRLASFSVDDDLLHNLEWKHPSIEAACCFGCALPDTASLTCVSYTDTLPRVVVQTETLAASEAHVWQERRFTLGPIGTKGLGRRSRLGGEAAWLQSDATPDCPGCQQPMHFLAQLASSSKGPIGADGGMAYVFICQACHMVGTVVQSH
ncbi:MAG: hypothetical protein CFE44_07925 [Burkholderiales bacterium PBB4]|nr:MAG: hypothetical protein CFE44_07925 [Burkholderiales bacterium PBB4]